MTDITPTLKSLLEAGKGKVKREVIKAQAEALQEDHPEEAGLLKRLIRKDDSPFDTFVKADLDGDGALSSDEVEYVRGLAVGPGIHIGQIEALEKQSLPDIKDIILDLINKDIFNGDKFKTVSRLSLIKLADKMAQSDDVDTRRKAVTLKYLVKAENFARIDTSCDGELQKDEVISLMASDGNKDDLVYGDIKLRRKTKPPDVNILPDLKRILDQDGKPLQDVRTRVNEAVKKGPWSFFTKAGQTNLLGRLLNNLKISKSGPNSQLHSASDLNEDGTVSPGEIITISEMDGNFSDLSPLDVLLMEDAAIKSGKYVGPFVRVRTVR